MWIFGRRGIAQPADEPAQPDVDPSQPGIEPARPVADRVEAPEPVPVRRRASFVTDGRIDLAGLILVLLRQWLLIGTVTAVFAVAALAYLSVTPTTWRATSRVLLDPRDKQVVGNGVERPLQGVDAVWIDTQTDLVTASQTLRAVVESELLVDDPEFGGGTVEDAMREFADAVLVVRPELTYVLDINVTSRNADKSARLSRALADAFVKSLTDVKAESIRQANDLLSSQVDALRDKAREADEALQAYKRENGILAANGRLVDEETLQLLNTEYNESRLAAAAAKARRDRLVAALRAGDGQLDSSLEAANSTVVSRLKIEYALAQRTLADLAQQLGPDHPRLRAAEGQVARTRSLIQEELRSVAATAAAEYDLAAAREKSSLAALETATRTVNTSSAAGVRLRELENEATARREIYRAFVSRIEETGQQQNLQISDARVIVPAPVPQRPHAPRRTLVMALAVIAGLGAGLSAAIYRGRPFAEEEDAVLDLDEAVMPAAPPAVAPSYPARFAAPLEDPPAAPPQAFAAPTPSVDESGSAPAAAAPPPASVAPEPAAAPAQAATPAPAPAPTRPRRRRAGVVPVLVDLTVDTARETVGRHGRPIARSPRAVVGSAFEGEGGRWRTEVLRPIADVLVGPGQRRNRGEVVLVQSLCHPDPGAAASLTIAAAFSFAGETTLLVDASSDRALADAFLDDDGVRILDVIAGHEAAEDLDAAIEAVATVVALGGDLDEELDLRAQRIADFVFGLADGFGRTVVHCGDDIPPRLFAALAAGAGRILVAVDPEIERHAADVIAELAASVPRVAGIISVAERAGAAQVAA